MLARHPLLLWERWVFVVSVNNASSSSSSSSFLTCFVRYVWAQVLSHAVAAAIGVGSSTNGNGAQFEDSSDDLTDVNLPEAVAYDVMRLACDLAPLEADVAQDQAFMDLWLSEQLQPLQPAGKALEGPSTGDRPGWPGGGYEGSSARNVYACVARGEAWTPRLIGPWEVDALSARGGSGAAACSLMCCPHPRLPGVVLFRAWSDGAVDILIQVRRGGQAVPRGGQAVPRGGQAVPRGCRHPDPNADCADCMLEW